MIADGIQLVQLSSSIIAAETIQEKEKEKSQIEQPFMKEDSVKGRTKSNRNNQNRTQHEANSNMDIREVKNKNEK